MQVLLYFIAQGLTKCIPSAFGGALKGADDLKVLAAMPLLRKPYDTDLTYAYQIVFLWTCKPVESLTCKCSRSVGSMRLFVKKHLHALLACDNAACSKSGENSRTDFMELFHTVRVSTTTSAGSQLNTYFLGTSSCSSVTREWKLWVCESVCVWVERYEKKKKGLKWPDLILKNALEKHLEKDLNHRRIEFRLYQFFWWFWLH